MRKRSRRPAGTRRILSLEARAAPPERRLRAGGNENVAGSNGDAATSNPPLRFFGDPTRLPAAVNPFAVRSGCSYCVTIFDNVSPRFFGDFGMHVMATLCGSIFSPSLRCETFFHDELLFPPKLESEVAVGDYDG